MMDGIRDVREIIREEMVMRDRILEVLQEGSKTVPEIADAIEYPSPEVMYWVMGMRKYGYVTEDGQTDEGYFLYRPVKEEAK
ncbi:MAG: MarR family transcriptional regulator [Peptococcaceae bacterium]|nr:MarR family transcriptional regulator [Peptococcaceae bacterium]